MSYFESLQKARELGCNLFVSHEPTYYDHFDRDTSVFAFDIAKRKKEFIEQSGIAILRCHDVWDRVPEIGIRDAWARFLGLGKEIDTGRPREVPQGTSFCGVFEITPLAAGEFARRVAAKVAPLGQNAVLFLGPDDKVVRSVAVGTGAGTPFRQMAKDLKADLAVCTDDGFAFWRDGSLAIDMGYPVIVVNHPCSEEVGIKRLAEHLAEKFHPVPVHYIPQRCMFRCVSAWAGVMGIACRRSHGPLGNEIPKQHLSLKCGYGLRLRHARRVRLSQTLVHSWHTRPTNQDKRGPCEDEALDGVDVLAPPVGIRHRRHWAVTLAFPLPQKIGGILARLGIRMSLWDPCCERMV